MAKKEKENKGGRKLKPINWKKVDEALRAHCTGVEIAAYFDLHPDTFYRRVQEEKGVGFTEYSQQKKAKGKSLLKLAQMDKALDGNVPMQIWLGKNLLDQADKKEVEQKINIPVEITTEGHSFDQFAGLDEPEEDGQD